MDAAPQGAAGLPPGAVDVEAAWAELHLRLQRSKGLCLVFLYAEQDSALATLRTRVDDAWSWRTAPLRLLRPQRPAEAAAEVLAALQQELRDHPAVRAPVWVELRAPDAAPAGEWEQARAAVLSRLNEWRSWLQGEFRRPLLITLPPAWRRLVVEAAPDLWQVRACSVFVGSGRPVALPRVQAPDFTEMLTRLKRPEQRSEALALADAALDRLMEDRQAALAVE